MKLERLLVMLIICFTGAACEYTASKNRILPPSSSQQSPVQTNHCAWLQTIQDITCNNDGKIYFTSSDGVFALAMTNGFDLTHIAELHQANRFNDNYRSYGIASSTNGNLYLADSYNHIIKVLHKNGELSILAGKVGSAGFVDADNGFDARFAKPTSLCFYTDTQLAVTDAGNNAIRIVDIDNGATHTLVGRHNDSPFCRMVEMVADELDYHTMDGDLATATFRNPCYIRSSNNKRLIIASNAIGIEGAMGNTIRAIDRDAGRAQTLAGQSISCNSPLANLTDGSAHISQLSEIQGMAVTPDGYIFIGNYQYVRKITPIGLTSTIYTNTMPMHHLTTDKLSFNQEAAINPVLALCWQDHTNTLLIFSAYSIVQLAFDEQATCTNAVTLLTFIHPQVCPNQTHSHF